MNPTHCSVCDKVFSSKYNLNRHTISCQRRVEKQVKPTICDVCGKILSNFGNLKRHMKLHTASNTSEVAEAPDTLEVAESSDTPEVVESSDTPEVAEVVEFSEDPEQEFICLVCKRKCTLENDCYCPTTVYINSNLVYNVYY